MLPNFLIIGAAKAGTTSLYRYLARHPEIFMSRPKELKFFVEEHNWSRGVEWYEQQFTGAGDAIARGEASTHYTAYPHFGGVPRRIADVIPDTRLIYVIRQPIDRMISHYWMRVRQGKERERSIERALLTDERYVDSSRYSMQIEQYLEYFRLDRLMIIISDDLRTSRGPTLQRVCRFLGVDPRKMPVDVDIEYNTARSKSSRAIRPSARTALQTIRRIPGIVRLSAMAPPGLKMKVGRSITHPAVTTDFVVVRSISANARRELETRLRPDITRLGRYIEADFDGWGLV
jgi:hypothetical protein